MSEIDELRAIGDFDTLAFCQRFIAALEEENTRLENRIGELVPQCDAAYAPYREIVQAVRAKYDRLEADKAALTVALEPFAQFHRDYLTKIEWGMGDDWQDPRNIDGLCKAAFDVLGSKP